MTTSEFIEKGGEHNVLVYDEDAKPRQFTPRLVQLFQAVVGQMFPNDPPAKILVPSWTRIPCDGGSLSVIGGNYWGIPIETIHDHAEFEFTRQGMSFPRNKCHLVALVTQSGRVVFGGF